MWPDTQCAQSDAGKTHQIKCDRLFHMGWCSKHQLTENLGNGAKHGLKISLLKDLVDDVLQENT